VTKDEFRAILLDLGLTQAALAKDVGVTRRAVVYWAAGKRAVPARVVTLLRQAMLRGWWESPTGSAGHGGKAS
jgi:transcriptional regulator with XRE-family HTH domain